MKYVLILFAIILTLIPEVYAKNDKWIDGIRIRYGVSGVLPRIKFVSPGKKQGKTILKSHDNIASHNFSAGSGAPPYDKPMFPIAIELAETLMGKNSFRGGYLDFAQLDIKNLAPSSELKLGNNRITHPQKYRENLKTNFFNEEELEFANSNPNWAMSGDVKSDAIYFAYYWGLFYPLFENHRIFKFGLGFNISKIINAKISIYLCGEYLLRPDNNCIGEKMISSKKYNGFDFTTSLSFFFNAWEKITKDSIWRILTVNVLLDDDRFIEVRDTKEKFTYEQGVGSIEVISYTSRF